MVHTTPVPRKAKPHRGWKDTILSCNGVLHESDSYAFSGSPKTFRAFVPSMAVLRCGTCKVGVSDWVMGVPPSEGINVAFWGHHLVPMMTGCYKKSKSGSRISQAAYLAM
jgi:hypothetical protein